jgi:DnaJ homolog subfamily B member 4
MLDSEVYVSLTLTQIYNGGKIPFDYERKYYGKRIIIPGKGPIVPVEKIESTKLYFQLRPGHSSERKLILKEKGHVNLSHKGDIYIHIVELEHPFFSRTGNDLIIKLDITLKESLLGVKKKLYHLDSNKIEIEYNDIISPKDEFRIKTKGMNKKGNLIVKWNIIYPKELNETQKNMVQTIF